MKNDLESSFEMVLLHVDGWQVSSAAFHHAVNTQECQWFIFGGGSFESLIWGLVGFRNDQGQQSITLQLIWENIATATHQSIL